MTAPDRDPVVAALTEIASIWHDYNSMQVLDRLDNEAMAELDRRWANIPAAFAAALPIARAQAALEVAVRQLHDAITSREEDAAETAIYAAIYAIDDARHALEARGQRKEALAGMTPEAHAAEGAPE